MASAAAIEMNIAVATRVATGRIAAFPLRERRGGRGEVAGASPTPPLTPPHLWGGKDEVGSTIQWRCRWNFISIRNAEHREVHLDFRRLPVNVLRATPLSLPGLFARPARRPCGLPGVAQTFVDSTRERSLLSVCRGPRSTRVAARARTDKSAPPSRRWCWQCRLHKTSPRRQSEPRRCEI